MENLKILFISRAYPPVVGGIENQNYELGRHLGQLTPTTVLANKHGRKFLPLFAPYALLKTLFSLRRYDAILLGDGVLAFVAWTVKLFSNKPVICVIHGLDVNYNSASLKVWYEKLLITLYQNIWVKIFLPRVDHFIAVGNETARVAMEKGIPQEKIAFIPNGTDTEKYFAVHERRELDQILKMDTCGKCVLLTSGRLAKRKGAAWFSANVMPLLDERFVYVIAGDGPDRADIEKAVRENNLGERVKMLGLVSEETKKVLFNTCDIFIQANVKIAGDMEGFGISVIEAASCELPVLAARLEGLVDAIKDGQNGFLVESGNAAAWKEKIIELFTDEKRRKDFGRAARRYVAENYAWPKIANLYLEKISQIATK